MNADLSVAPEIAQLAASHAREDSVGSSPRANTAGRVAGELARLAATPQRWWDLVRFDPDAPARIPVPGTEGIWLLVLPPGASADCDCGYATLLAGEAAETTAAAGVTETAETTAAAGVTEAAGTAGTAAAAGPLRSGRVRVHGRPAPHRVRRAGPGYGYSVSLHAPFPAAAVPPGE